MIQKYFQTLANSLCKGKGSAVGYWIALLICMAICMTIGLWIHEKISYN